MNAFRLLVVEDNAQDLQTCIDTINRYNREKHSEIEVVGCRTIQDAFDRLDNSFDGAIIDLKLADVGDEGNKIAKKIAESNFRIPIAILTGTPDNADTELVHLGIFKKGETLYSELLDQFMDIHNTGLTRIMGGRGIIEKTLYEVFQKNLLPQKKSWIDYGTNDSAKTEKALLRHTLNHLIQLLDNDDDKFFPEEVYICPPLNTSIKTGSIVKRISDNKYFVVLNPACDLITRQDGNFKTDRILLVEIDEESIVKGFGKIQIKNNNKIRKDIENCKHHHADSISYKTVLKHQEDAIRHCISKLFANSHDLYHHWLPRTSFFIGGFINFRKITSHNKDEFYKGFYPPEIQISPSFIKDIIARFSSFYARQGQPDLECEKVITNLMIELET